MRDILIRPLVTEKMSVQTDKLNKYGFIVAVDANKVEIKKAIKAIYNVEPVSINTIRYDGKRKFRYTKTGITEGRSNSYKKAIVTLRAGDTIDFYANV